MSCREPAPDLDQVRNLDKMDFRGIQWFDLRRVKSKDLAAIGLR
jgi:hypothetical protein